MFLTNTNLVVKASALVDQIFLPTGRYPMTLNSLSCQNAQNPCHTNTFFFFCLANRKKICNFVPTKRR